MHIVLSPDLRGRMFEQLQKAFPNEGGGFLLGDLRDGTATIRDIYPVENIADESEKYHRYTMTPLDWARLEDEADARHLSLVGYYHSHPNSPAIPSEFDRVHALPNFRYLITSVREGKAVELRGWLLAADRACFDEVAVQIS